MKNPTCHPFKRGLLWRLAAGSVFAGSMIAPIHAADRWWDGGTSDIATVGDGASSGAAGTWNTSLLNWDQGYGLAHVAWNNAANDTAILGGTAGTVTLGSAVTANALVFTHTSSTYTLNGTTITFAGSAPRIINSGTTTINPALVGTGLTKGGAGLLTLRGTATHALTGGVTVNQGILELDFVNFATATNLLDSGNSATLGGGTLRMKGKSTGTSSQTLSGVILNGGASGISVNSNGGTGNLTLGAITRNPGAGVNFTLPALGSITTTSNNSNGILGTWASTGSTASTQYATRSGSDVVALTGTAAADGSALTDVTGTVNYDLAAGGGTVPASLAAHTIRYTGAAGTTAPGATLFSVNGLMNVGTGVWTIGSGSVTIGLDRELVIHAPNSGGITFTGVVKDNGAGASGVTIIGTNSGLVTLGTANTYTGATTINGSSAYGDGGKTLIVTSLKNGGTVSEFGAGSSIALNGAVVQTGATGTSDRTITLSGNSGFYVKGVFTQTLTGPISGAGNLGVDGDYNGGAQGGSGNLVLEADNSFTGSVVFQADSRITLKHAGAVKNATLNLSGARSMADLTTYDLNYIIGGLTGSANVDLGSGNVSIGNNDQSTTYTGILSGAGSLTKIGNGNLTLTGANTYAGNTTVNGGTLSMGSNALPDSTKLTINGGKVAPTGTDTVDTLYFGAVQQAAGTWGATGSGAEHIDDTHFAGTAGVVQVQPWSIGNSTLIFGNVTINDTISMSVTITNLGSASISGSASVGGAPYAVVSGASWSAPASGTTTVTVSFNPTATGSFPNILTLIGNGLTRNVSLSGNGVAFVAPSPSSTAAYSLDVLAGMAAPAATANIPMTQGAVLTQSFIPRRDAFLAGYAARDSVAPTTTQLKTVTIKTNAAQSSFSTMRFEVLRIETGGARTVIATQDFQQKFFNTTYTFTFASPPTLNFDTTYELRLTYVVSGGPLSLYAPSSNYADGSLSTSGDLWLDLGGTASIPIYSQLTVTADAANRFFLDGDPFSADSTSYGYLFGKLLGIGGVAEKINFNHPASWGAPTYEIENTAIATRTSAGRTSTVDTLALSGVAEGATFLWVKVGSTVVGCVKQQVYPQRSMKLSYTYVQFPGESNHVLKTPAYAADVMAYVSSIYAKANVAIAWQDNGILTHEWDKDGDGQSYEDDYNEVWSPIDDGVIPNQTSVFSNVYMLRYDKDDATIRGSGGGTSRGFGEIPPPANFAMVRCTLNRDAVSHGSTLAHEVGHNCGLGHTNFGNNMMDVGGSVDNLAGWQWDIIHSMIQSLPTAIRGPVINSTPVPPSGMVGQSYNHTFTANGGTPGYTWALESGSLPPGVTRSGATISGTPTMAGIYNFTLRVTDSTTAYTTASFSISVGLASGNVPPSFTADPINLAATEDTAFSDQLTATDANAGDTLTYSKVSGPAWLTVSSTGALSGTPSNSEVGANAFVVQVSDGMASVTAALNITVANVNDAPAFASDPINLNGTEDAAFTGQLSASDVDAGDTLSYTKVSGPAWLTVSSSGALSGTPSNANVGANNFLVRVTDGSGAFDEAALAITIANVNDAPVFSVDPILAADASEAVAYTGQTLAGSATDADAGDSITYSKVSGPAWLSVASNGALSGTPPTGSAGLNSFVVRATDSASATDDCELRINVTGLPLPWTSADIGTGMLTGSASLNSGTFTQAGSGALGGTTDNLRYTYQALTGDGEIIARISTLQNTGSSSRVGVMIRESLAANSRQVFMGLTGSGSYRWVRRSSTGGSNSTNNSSTGTVPNTWVKLERKGSSIIAYKSSDGASWTTVGSTTVTIATNCYIGLAVSSGSNTTLNTSQFSNVSVTP